MRTLQSSLRTIVVALVALASGCFQLAPGDGGVPPCADATQCAPGTTLVDLNADRCADRCEATHCASVPMPTCGGAMPVDEDGDGCARECPPPVLTSCAGFGCAADQFCDYPLDAACGGAMEGGTCRARPTVCTEQYSPVCGCDGRTYSNECAAHGAGASIAHWGACEQSICDFAILCVNGTLPIDTDGDGCVDGCEPVACPAYYPDCGGEEPIDADGDGCALECPSTMSLSCGGLTPNGSPTCPADMFCDYQPGALCGWADAPGTCRTAPTLCTRDYAPVCGCDGVTYGNACVAAMNQVGVLSEGPCERTCEPIDCVEPNHQPTDTDGDGCADACRTVCGGFAGFACPRGELCYYAPGDYCGAADQFGSCAAPPLGCPDHIDPVCGCDGRTYSNGCEALAAGVSIQHLGACSVLCPLYYPDCGPNGMPVDGDGDGCLDGCSP